MAFQFDWSQFDPKPVQPGFEPHFKEQQYVTDGTFSWPINTDYFATLETAQYIAANFGDGKVYEVDFEGVGGNYSATSKMYVTKTTTGRGVNCGMLAAYFKRNPDSGDTKGLAAKLIKAVLANG